jgi:hypothetical protein
MSSERAGLRVQLRSLNPVVLDRGSHLLEEHHRQLPLLLFAS